MPGSLLATTGGGLVGFLYAAVYGAGSIGKWLQDLALSTGAGFIGCIHTGAGAVARTVRDKMRETVSPEDFGAVGTGLVDDTAAVQRAIDAWSLSRTTEIKLVNKYLIDGTLTVGNLETDNPETRLKFVGGGTLIKNNAGFMFDKPGGQALQTGHIYFNGTRFEGANLVGQTFILNGDNVIRVHFIGCFGTKINIAKAAGYLQTIYCSAGTTWRKWSGYLFDCNYLFDISWDGVAEAGDAFMITRDATADPACNALHITGNIEGLTGVSGPAIKVGVCYASTIISLYCEQNAGGDIDASGGTSFHKGLTIQSCGFQPTAAQMADATYYPVKTGKGAVDSIVLIGNSSTHNLFDVAAANQSGILDTGNSVASGKLKFSTTSPRIVSLNGTGLKVATLPGFGVHVDGYYGSVGFEGTRGTVNGESVTSGVLFGSVNPQTSPGSYVQTNWKAGTFVHHTAPFLSPRQYGAVVTDALIIGWKCMTDGAPGTWREVSIMQPY
jgi:hypothetical protein